MGQIATMALTTAINLAQARQRARAQNAAAAQQAQFQTEQIRRQQDIRDRQRREQLRHALATQRARFGAQGIGGGGSAGAVLKGLTNETNRAIKDESDLNALRIGAIDTALENRRRRNLLELSNARSRSAFGLFQQGLRGVSLLD